MHPAVSPRTLNSRQEPLCAIQQTEARIRICSWRGPVFTSTTNDAHGGRNVFALDTRLSESESLSHRLVGDSRHMPPWPQAYSSGRRPQSGLAWVGQTRLLGMAEEQPAVNENRLHIQSLSCEPQLHVARFPFKPAGWANRGAPVSWSDLQGGKTGARKWRSAAADPPN